MNQLDSFADLMSRLESNDPEAARELFERFVGQLIGLARCHLDTMVRPKVDPEDVVQSVFRSFFAGHAEGQFRIENWNSLWGLLALITLRKCGHWNEYFHAARRDVAREVPAQRDSVPSGIAWEPVAREPTPPQALVLVETLEQVMRPLSERERRILALSLQGHDAAEISAQVGRSERTVWRLLRQVGQELEYLLANANGSE